MDLRINNYCWDYFAEWIKRIESVTCISRGYESREMRKVLSNFWTRTEGRQERAGQQNDGRKRQ